VIFGFDFIGFDIPLYAYLLATSSAVNAKAAALPKTKASGNSRRRPLNTQKRV